MIDKILKLFLKICLFLYPPLPGADLGLSRGAGGFSKKCRTFCRLFYRSSNLIFDFFQSTKKILSQNSTKRDPMSRQGVELPLITFFLYKLEYFTSRKLKIIFCLLT